MPGSEELSPTRDGVSKQDTTEIAALVKNASSSFYWAMRILPEERRKAIFAVYAFCRVVDDIADDEGNLPEERRTALEEWRNEVDNIYDGRTSSAITRALKRAITIYKLEKQDFIAVIAGMEMDAGLPIQAPLRHTFDIYCDRVACAVGRLCVNIFGEPTEHGKRLADAQGRALQITNILRDVQEDADRDRLYLPAELLEGKGIYTSDPKAVVLHPEYVSAWRTLAVEASGWFTKADAVMEKCDARAIKPSRIMFEVYRRNLDRMRSLSDAEIADPNVSKRLVGKAEKMRIAIRYGLF